MATPAYNPDLEKFEGFRYAARWDSSENPERDPRLAMTVTHHYLKEGLKAKSGTEGPNWDASLLVNSMLAVAEDQLMNTRGSFGGTGLHRAMELYEEEWETRLKGTTIAQMAEYAGVRKTLIGKIPEEDRNLTFGAVEKALRHHALAKAPGLVRDEHKDHYQRLTDDEFTKYSRVADVFEHLEAYRFEAEKERVGPQAVDRETDRFVKSLYEEKPEEEEEFEA